MAIGIVIMMIMTMTTIIVMIIIIMGIIIIFPMFRTNSNVFLDNVEAGGGGGSFVHFSCNWGLFGVIFGVNPCLDIIKKKHPIW